MAERAVARARAGEGPTLIEAKSYRITPHSAATPNDNRPPEVLDHWRERDPIAASPPGDARHVTPRAARGDRGGGTATWRGDRVRAGAPVPAEPRTDVYAPGDWNADGRLA